MRDLDERATRAGLSLLQIARRTEIHAWKLYGGYDLTVSERARLDDVLGRADYKHERYRDAAVV